jgi:WD40 repeat protein/Flp pilus assembly protein TadD
LPLDFRPGGLAFDRPGERIAVTTADQPLEAQIRDFGTGRVQAAWTDQVGNGAISWSDDGRLLAVGHADGRVFIWDAKVGRVASVLNGHTSLVIRCRFAPAAHLLATSSWDGTFRLWDAATGEPLLAATGAVSQFSPDGRRFASFDGPAVEVYDVAHGQEVRALDPGSSGNQTDGTNPYWVHAARFSPDGRLLALGARGGVGLHDASSGRELAWLSAGLCSAILFDQDGRHLITYGERGLFRWPIGNDPDGRALALSIGPPELLEEVTPDGFWHKASWLPDHRTLAINDNKHAHVLLVDTTGPRRVSIGVRSLSSGLNHRMTSIAVSPDGRWAAAGGWKEAGICIWDLPRRRRQPILPAADGEGDTSTFVAFSPDGRWLVSCSANQLAPGYYFWEVGTWKRGPMVPLHGPAGLGAPVFSSDGRLMALSVSAHQIRLAETASSWAVAHLTTLQPLSATPLAFSPEGTRLIASTNRGYALMWDLRRIRDQLGTIDLDWDQPSFPPEGETPTTKEPEVPSIHVVGKVLESSARRAAELATLNQQLHSQPDDADALFERADLKLRAMRWSEAIADLELGLRLRPGEPDARLRLAEAYLQTDSLTEAGTALDQHLARAPSDLDARHWRGLVALRLGHSQAAADDFTNVLAADPEHEAARDARARAWLALGRPQDALADLDELIRSHPGDASFIERRGEVHERLGHDEAAGADRARAAELPQPSSWTLNDTASELITGAVYLRDPERAVRLAKKAVALAPSQATFVNTLGIALYRARRYAEAVSTLEQSLAAGRGKSDAFNLFFLAMARHRLGQRVQARDSFDRAVRWWGEQKQLPEPYAVQLAEFRAEADAVLACPINEIPGDVFGRPSSPGQIR